MKKRCTGTRCACRDAEQGQLWILAIADRGIIVHAQAYPNEHKARAALATYLRKHESYEGPNKQEAVDAWLGSHDERLSAEIICQSGPK